MNINYKNKYLKYKNKYINLKFNKVGGSKKVNLVHFGEDCSPGILINDILNNKDKTLFSLGLFKFNSILEYIKNNKYEEIYLKDYLSYNNNNIKSFTNNKNYFSQNDIYVNHTKYKFSFLHDFNLIPDKLEINNYNFIVKSYKKKIKYFKKVLNDNNFTYFITFSNDKNIKIKEMENILKEKKRNLFKLLIFTNNKLIKYKKNIFVKIIYLKNNYENWYINKLEDRFNLYKEIYNKFYDCLVIKNIFPLFKNTFYKNVINNKYKVAFLFLTVNDINYPKIWKKYLNLDKCNIYVHSKNKENVKSFFSKYLIEGYVPTKWGDISIVKSLLLLLENAIKNKENKYFVFVSESCLPIVNFNIFYNKLIKINKSIFTLVNNTNNSLKRYDYIKNPKNIGLNKLNFLKAETWCILTRNHVKKMLENNKKNIYLNTFKDVKIPEEHYFVNFVNLEFKKQIYNFKSTFVLWTEKDFKHPYSFGPLLNIREKNIIKKASEESFFMRKFKYGDKNNIYEFILNLIS